MRRPLDDKSAAILNRTLRKQLYVIYTTPISSDMEHRRLMPEHLAYQIELERRGIMFGAGPLVDENGETDGRGMVIVRAKSIAEAEAIAKGDPIHQAGLRTFRIERWMMNEGTMTFKVNYSDQTVEIV